MIRSPLQLEHHFFTQIHLEAHPDADPEKTVNSQTEVECARHEDDPRRWMITLTVTAEHDDDSDESITPYTGRFEIVGMFRVAEDYPEEKVSQLVHANGAAVLYGSVRELLANLTARGPFSQVILPTTTFIDECSRKKEVTSDNTNVNQK